LQPLGFEAFRDHNKAIRRQEPGDAATRFVARVVWSWIAEEATGLSPPSFSDHMPVKILTNGHQNVPVVFQKNKEAADLSLQPLDLTGAPGVINTRPTDS
jgi:hypothetical protein